MVRVQDTVRTMRLQGWALQVRECQNSGLSVREWCEENGVGYKNYYRRRRLVREHLLDTSDINKSLTVTSNKALQAEIQAPVFAAIPTSKINSSMIAATVQINTYIAEINNGADMETVDGVLRTLSRL